MEFLAGLEGRLSSARAEKAAEEVVKEGQGAGRNRPFHEKQIKESMWTNKTKGKTLGCK